MSAANVIEDPLRLEPVGADPFVADLEDRSPETESRRAALLARIAASPRRRIDD